MLHTSRRIAVIGASSRPGRPSYGVFRTLLDYGYDCVPVNPKETAVHGIPAFPTLEEAAAATGPFDLVDVFRRSDQVVPHAHEAVAIGARCFWLQLGIVNWEAATIAGEAGLLVVMDRCTAIELRRFGGPAGSARGRTSRSSAARVASSVNATSHAVRWIAADLLGREAGLGLEPSLLGGERRPDVDRVVVADDHPAAGGQELAQRMLGDRPRGAGEDVRGQAHLDGDALACRPREHGRVVDDVRAVADPAHAEQLDRVDGGARRPCLGGVGGQPQAGGGRDREGLAVRLERRVEQLVARNVEPHDATAGRRSRGAGNGTVRLLVVVAERAHHQPDRHPGRTAAFVQARTRSVDDCGDVEPGPGMRRGAEADLQVVAAVGGGVFDGLARDATHGLGRAQHRVGRGHVAEVDRQVGRLAHAQRRVPAARWRGHAQLAGEVRGRVRADPAFEMRVEVEAHAASERQFDDRLEGGLDTRPPAHRQAPMRLLVVHARAGNQVARDRADHAGTQAALTGHDEERRRLHLDVEQPESRHLLGPRRGLGVEGVVGDVEAGVHAEVVLRPDDRARRGPGPASAPGRAQRGSPSGRRRRSCRRCGTSPRSRSGHRAGCRAAAQRCSRPG